MACIGLLAATMLLFPGDGKSENPWKDKVAKSVQKAETSKTAESIAEALDTAWRADNWSAGLKVARLAREKHPDSPKLTGLVARALWRAGQLLEAERIAAGIDPSTTDRVALAILIEISLSRGETDRAVNAGEKLASLPDPTAAELMLVMALRMEQKKLDGLAGLVDRAAKRMDPKNGYPETHLGEELDGLPEFLRRVGAKPMNQITSFGSAVMLPIPMINLPGCDVMVNGKGPYRMIVDTGGSITLSLDDAVADEIGIERIAGSSVRGVSGKDVASQALVNELRIGDIVCTRVMTRVFAVKKSAAYSCDGIVGTGMFADCRMTLDFENSRLIIRASGDASATGKEAPLRVISDAKLISPVTIHGEPACALLDSGADVVALSPSRLRGLFPEQKIKTIPVAMAGVGAESTPGVSFSKGVDLVFAGRTYPNTSGLGLDVLDTILSTYLGVQSDVLIGMSMLRETKSLTVDFPKRRMWIDWLEP